MEERRTMQRQHLLIDADDTLWENNIYFERAIHDFMLFLDHSSLQPAEVRAVLNEIEHEMGYGSANFTRSLLETYRRLHHPIEVISGVEETLTYLAPRHHLILLTKGEEEEQKFKIENSGLAGYFSSILITPEKDLSTYHTLVQEMQLDPSNTWMIGNSPRSDINPALAAGLNAVFIPHQHTWQLEIQEVFHTGPGKLVCLDKFAQLREYF
jgi:putative hydrolase of the HAD superfamily